MGHFVLRLDWRASEPDLTQALDIVVNFVRRLSETRFLVCPGWDGPIIVSLIERRQRQKRLMIYWQKPAMEPLFVEGRLS